MIEKAKSINPFRWMTLAIWFWIVVSTWALLLGTGDMFQRIGTIGICAAVLSAVAHQSSFQKLMHNFPHFENDTVIDRAEAENYFLEAFVVCLATLQTGFGDWFYDWFIGLL